MIQYLFTDVDGTLTDGKVYIGDAGEIMKAFSIKDGYAINYILKPAGIIPVVITGRKSKIVENRCKELGIADCYQGITDKLPVLEKHIGAENIGKCAYFGDDILDLEPMRCIQRKGGFVGCPADAVDAVKAAADYVCKNKAGEGAFREFAEWLVSGKTKKNSLEKSVEFAVQYIRDLDKNSLSPGTYRVNDDFYYSVQEYYTKDKKDCITESHRKYLDVQWIVEGEEKMFLSDISKLYLQKEYCEEKDIALWEPIDAMTQIVLLPGAYTVLYPENAHMGCVAINGPVKVKKIVGKVRIRK